MELEVEKKKSDGGFAKGLFVGILLCALVALVVLLIVNPKQQTATVDEVTTGKQESTNTNVVAPIGSSDESSRADTDLAAIKNKLSALEKYVDTYFYYDEDMDMDAIAENVYKAYIEGLDDPYSAYYTEEELASMLESVTGTYCGIGAVVSQNVNEEVIILLPYEGAPAFEAGLRPGDVILAIEDTELTGMELDQAVAIVKGEEGSAATFTVRRGEDIFEVEITRRKIDIPTVSGEMKDGNIGYVQITSFDTVTVEQFTTIVDDLLAQGAKGLIFDLRDNGGGSLDSVVKMLDYLLPEGILVYMEDKYDNRKNYYSEEGCIDENIPMVVLINGNSASASEVFAGALQDYERAQLIGTKSYGKGVVQNLMPLSDGSGLKLTIAVYFTPLGRNLNHNGIDPDTVVELEVDENSYDETGFLKEECDTQLQAALQYMREQVK